jgi:hypothetical protein
MVASSILLALVGCSWHVLGMKQLTIVSLAVWMGVILFYVSEVPRVLFDGCHASNVSLNFLINAVCRAIRFVCVPHLQRKDAAKSAYFLFLNSCIHKSMALFFFLRRRISERQTMDHL